MRSAILMKRSPPKNTREQIYESRKRNLRQESSESESSDELLSRLTERRLAVTKPETYLYLVKMDRVPSIKEYRGRWEDVLRQAYQDHYDYEFLLDSFSDRENYLSTLSEIFQKYWGRLSRSEDKKIFQEMRNEVRKLMIAFQKSGKEESKFIFDLNIKKWRENLRETNLFVRIIEKNSKLLKFLKDENILFEAIEPQQTLEQIYEYLTDLGEISDWNGFYILDEKGESKKIKNFNGTPSLPKRRDESFDEESFDEEDE